MKKFLTLLFTAAVACSLSLPVFAQGTAGSTVDAKAVTGKKTGKMHKAHKRTKKSKKSSEGTTTPAPK